MMDMGNDSNGDDEDVKHGEKLYEAAQKEFIKETRRSVRTNLEDANLPDQRVCIVSNVTIWTVVLNKVPKTMTDEVDLFSDLLKQAYMRWVDRSDEVGSTRIDSGSSSGSQCCNLTRAYDA